MIKKTTKEENQDISYFIYKGINENKIAKTNI